MNKYDGLIAVILTILLSTISNAYGYVMEEQNITDDGTIHALYCDPSPITCWGENRLYFDAPWRVNPNNRIEIYGIINLEYDIKRIIVYDLISGSIVAERTFDDILSINASQIPYVLNFSLDPHNLSVINNRARLGMTFTVAGIWDSNETEAPLEILLSNETVPTLKNWYYGDTHYHSSYTLNDVELGGPLPATINSMKAIGLDWVTLTDHSFALKTDEKWTALRDECNRYSNCLIGEEISCDNPNIGNYNHYLGYNLTNRIYSGEYPDNGTSPQPCNDIVNEVNAQGGFGYTAHPFYIEGGWGVTYRNIWQDYNLPFTGMEIWNHEEAIDELEQGLLKWRDLLLSGRKIFIEAGSDAHGDFNSALGKVRTACFASNFTKDNIFSALKSGSCMMTDGPIVVFTANKHILGESFNVSEGDTIQLNISWNSTNEFGNVTEILLIRGEINGMEINETILSPNNLSGNFVIASMPNNTYYRIEARSFDPEGNFRRAYTNPIWAYAEPSPEIEKIPMNETELALVARFENKYDYSLKDLFFDEEPNLNCNEAELRENLNLNSSWRAIKCEKMILDGKRLMWAGFNNTETNEKKIVLQIGGVLQYSDATYNEFMHAWKTYYWKQNSGDYRNYNWIAIKNGTPIFEINEIYNSNAMNEFGPGTKYFGTYLIHGFKKYEENTTAYYTYWGPSAMNSYARNVYLRFDNKSAFPITDGYILNTKGIFHKKSFKYGATSFNFGSDGVYLNGVQSIELVYGSGFDQINRTIFHVRQTDSIIFCHSDIDCNDGDLLTKDICTNAGTPNSKCEHSLQNPEELKKPFTEMDADEVSKAIDFKTKHNKTFGEIYFDGQANVTCNTAGILETLKLDGSWTVVECKKFRINGTLAMFTGLNNSITGKQYAAYQLGNVLIDGNATFESNIFDPSRINPATWDMVMYSQNTWIGIQDDAHRFEVRDLSIKMCTINTPYYGNPLRCGATIPYANYIIHGVDTDENKNTFIEYSFNKSLDWAAYTNITFDNYKTFSLENMGYNEDIYAKKTFDYHAFKGWALLSYPINNRSMFPTYRANELIVGLESPAHLRAQDSQNRITGYFNGSYITEIPSSEILDTEHEKYLLPANETYKFFVQGYTDGNYSLKITRASGDKSSIIYFKNISATNETSDVFELNGTDGIGIKTNDSEKNIVTALDSLESSESINFTTAKNKSVSIDISNWSTLNESATVTEYINYAPEIISAYPENGSIFGVDSTIAISVSASDANNDTLNYAISFDGAELAQTNETTYTLNDVGMHKINFGVSDGLNAVSEEIEIYVIAPPKITISSPENRTYNDSTISVSAVFEEPSDMAWITIDGAPEQNYTRNIPSISLDTGALADGAHSIRIYANNSLGAINYSEISFTIDTIPPYITIQSPLNQPYNSSLIRANISLSEPGVLCNISIGGTENLTMQNETQAIWLKNISFESDGEQNIKYYCEDAAGNIGESQAVYFLIDTTPPVIDRTIPANNSIFQKGQIIPISINAIDSINSAPEYIIWFDGTEISRANETAYLLNEPGNHTMVFIASDGLNSVSESIGISVVPPVNITLASPENKTYSDARIMLNATFNYAMDSAWISIDDGAFQNHTYGARNMTFVLDALTEGAHSVAVYANNSAGIIDHSTAYFSIALPKNNGKIRREYAPGFSGIVSDAARQNLSANNVSLSAPEKTSETAPQNSLSGNNTTQIRESILETPETPTGFLLSSVSSIAAKIQTALLKILHIFGI